MPETTSSSIESTVDSIKTAEDTLTQMAANELADENYKGVATNATITDVITENLDEDEVLQVELELPNEKTGHITFNSYQYDSGEVEEFLEMVGCTYSDMSSALYETVPATYTEMYGWIVLYDTYKPNLKAFKGESKFRTLSEQFGSSRPVKPVQYAYASVLPLSTIIMMFYSGEFTAGVAGVGLFIGFILFIGLWYCDAAWSGMSMPNKEQVNDISEL